MNVMYILYREDIYSPLVESQVLNNLYRIAKNPEVNIHFLWLKRIDYCFRNKDKIATVREKMEQNGVFLHEFPIIVGKFPLKKGMFDFVYVQVARKIKKLIRENDINIVHTRGYNAGLLATNLKEEKCNFAHIFDPRSPYITEIVSTYKIAPGSRIFSYWEKNEKNIVSKAEATIAISDAFKKYLSQFGDKIIYIPNNSDMEKPETVIKRVEKQRRKAMCFVGSLGYGWNNVLEYITFMKKVLELDSDVIFELYVLEASRPTVEMEMKKSGIQKERYLIASLPADKVGMTISGCLAGLQIMSRKDTRLGIKTVDYLAAGVPVICNNNSIGAARIVSENQVGWNIDEMSLKEVLEEVNSNTDINKACVSIAYNNFSTDVVASKYMELYKNVE